MTVMLPPFKVVCSGDLHFFGGIMQCRMIVSYQHFGTTLEEIGCPKMFVQNYHSMLCKILKECRSHLHHGRSLKSRKFVLIHQHLVVPHKKSWKRVKTSQSEELSSPSCATIIICLSSDVMSSIMALEQK